MSGRMWLVATLSMVCLASNAAAEKVDLTPAQLKTVSTHIVTGSVIAVYQRTEDAGDWKYTRYVAEVLVDNCEQGEGLAKGDLAYVRYWHREWIGGGRIPPSTNGHRGIPAAGDTVRVYLARNAYDGFSNNNNDGGFNVIGANGFDKTTPAPAK